MTIDETLRVVGHLLEHHPTVRAFARDERGEALCYSSPAAACCWCLIGALGFVQCVFACDYSPLLRRTGQLLGPEMGEWRLDDGALQSALIAYWDDGTDVRRLRISRILQSAGR